VYIIGVSMIVASACTSPVRLVHPQLCSGDTLKSELLPAALAIPRREAAFVPPMPVSPRVRGTRAVARLVIDTLGRVMHDSVTICGLHDPMYAQRMAEELSQLRFRPGLMNARHVIAPTYLPFSF